MDLHRINSYSNERGQEISPHVFESGKPLLYMMLGICNVDPRHIFLLQGVEKVPVNCKVLRIASSLH